MPVWRGIAISAFATFAAWACLIAPVDAAPRAGGPVPRAGGAVTGKPNNGLINTKATDPTTKAAARKTKKKGMALKRMNCGTNSAAYPMPTLSFSSGQATSEPRKPSC